MAGAAFAHVSTDFVFDGTAHRPYPPDAAAEPGRGLWPDQARRRDVAAAEFHPVAAHRPHRVGLCRGKGNNFVATMLRLMRERGEVRVVADQFGTPTHAREHSPGRCGRSLADGHTGTFHATDAGTATWYDFAVAIARGSPCARPARSARSSVTPIRTEDYPTPAARPAFGVLDTTATWALTGVPARHWRDELRDVPHGR